MCGIFGYVGEQNALSIGLDGIATLEYRGYDSAGMALQTTDGIMVAKTEGPIKNLRRKLDGRQWQGQAGIWHTRWATHGEPSEANAHPHGDCRRRIWVVHNGIIQNHAELKRGLIARGHRFTSETDTEVLPHLIEECYTGDLAGALRSALAAVDGTYGIVAMAAGEPDRLVAARMESPLVIGVGERERFIASDPVALMAHTAEIIHLENGEIAVLTPTSHEITGHARLFR